MNRTSFCILACAIAANAQVPVPLAPNQTFHRTASDPAAGDSFAIPIQALGVQAGDWLRLRMLGDWDGGGTGDVLRTLVGAFAGGSTLLPPTQQLRLTAPVPGGSAYVMTHGTAVGNLPMEIAADFWIARQGFSDEVTVRVPVGAANLFVAVPDSFFGDNTDPDGDLAVEITLVPPPPYPGTGGEDLLLGSGAGGVLDLSPIKLFASGNTLQAAVLSPLDLLAGSPFLIVADLRATGTAPTGPLPGTWFGASAVIALGISPLPTGPSATLQIPIPLGFTGISIWLQGGALWSPARNGMFVASNAHEIRLQ